MLYHPNLIVYLWLLPVFIMIIVPLLFRLGCSVYRHTSWGQAACAREYEKMNGVSQANERRKHPRVGMKGAPAQVAGPEVCCPAMVENISSFGICMKNMPKTLLNGAEKFRVRVKTQAGNFEMLVNPRWKKPHGHGYLVGAEMEVISRN